MNIRVLLTCLLAFPLLASCVKQGDIDSLSARLSRNEQQMQQLSSQVGNVEQVLPGQAEMWAQMQAIRQELNTVRGQLDEANAGGGAGQGAQLTAKVNRLEVAVRQMAAELGVQVEALNAPLDVPGEPGALPAGATADGEGGQNAPLPPVTSAAGGTTTTPATPATPPATPATTGGAAVDTATNLYDSGMNAFASRNYRDAVKAFTDFATHFPQHKLTSNAQFWRGESYYMLKDYGNAVLAYNQVIEKHPGSAKFQSSMLKQGMALYYADKKDAAKIRLDDLIKRYPSSPEAGRAKKFLQQNK